MIHTIRPSFTKRNVTSLTTISQKVKDSSEKCGTFSLDLRIIHKKTATTSVAATEFRLLKRIGMLFIVAEDRVDFGKCNKGI